MRLTYTKASFNSRIVPGFPNLIELVQGAAAYRICVSVSDKRTYDLSIKARVLV